MVSRNSKYYQKSVKNFLWLYNFKWQILWFFEFLGTISSGFERVKNNSSSQKNQILRDLFICENGSNFSRSKLTQYRSLWVRNAFGLGSYKYMVFDHSIKRLVFYLSDGWIFSQLANMLHASRQLKDTKK